MCIEKSNMSNEKTVPLLKNNIQKISLDPYISIKKWKTILEDHLKKYDVKHNFSTSNGTINRDKLDNIYKKYNIYLHNIAQLYMILHITDTSLYGTRISLKKFQRYIDRCSHYPLCNGEEFIKAHIMDEIYTKMRR